MTGIFAVDRDMQDRADAVAGDAVYAQLFHQLVVADGDLHPIDRGGQTVAADLLDIGHAAAVDRLAVGPLQALADGVRGGALGMRGQLDELLVFQLVVVDAADLKYTLGQRTGLVEDHDLRLRKRLHVV